MAQSKRTRPRPATRRAALRRLLVVIEDALAAAGCDFCGPVDPAHRALASALDLVHAALAAEPALEPPCCIINVVLVATGVVAREGAV